MSIPDGIIKFFLNKMTKTPIIIKLFDYEYDIRIEAIKKEEDKK